MAVEDLFKSVAEQMMSGSAVELDGKKIPIKRSSSQRLKMVTFSVDGEEFTAIEQNPEKPSRWGKLARDGHRVVQIKDVKSNRFIAVVVDGDVKKYRSK
jgi:hypothetical protein